MPLATICPKCAYRWTLVEMVSRSWRCPRCQSDRNDRTLLCDCGHAYGDHDTARRVENSLVGFSLSAAAFAFAEEAADFIAQLPEGAVPAEPPIGGCGQCSCDNYRRETVK